MPSVRPVLQQRKGLLIVQGQLFRHQGQAIALVDGLDRVGQDGQVAVGQQVQLQQAGRLDGVHLPLGDDRPLGRGLQRHQVGQRLPADDDAAGVQPHVIGQAGEAVGHLQQRPVRLALLQQVLQVRAGLHRPLD